MGGTSNGAFTISNVFDKIDPYNTKAMEDHCKAIYNLNVLERIRVFIWMICQDRIQTNHYLNYLKLGDYLCDNCDEQVETTIHALRDCKVEK